jgi:hypothetical protein
MVLHNTYCSHCYHLSYSIALGMIDTNMKKACSQCGYIPARYICAQCGRIFCTSCMPKKDFVCNLCKMRGRDEPNRSYYNFKQNLIKRHYLFPISIAIILSGITLIALSLSYFPFWQIDDNNENSNTGNSGFIYIFPLPFAIPIDSTLVPYAIPIVILIVIAIPILVLVLISKRLSL